jgi:futalosine hydrolase
LYILKILVMTAVVMERDAVLRGLQEAAGFNVAIAGVGAASAAAQTATLLAADNYDWVISAGIAGGFAGRAEIGSIVIADASIAADLGAQTAEGFRSLDQLGFGSARVPVDIGMANQLTDAGRAAGLKVQTGAVLTVSTVTGTAESAEELAARIPEAAAEAMEGYGVGVAALNGGVPFLEIRTISNRVGPRDRSAWRIEEALLALEAASNTLREVLRCE